MATTERQGQPTDPSPLRRLVDVLRSSALNVLVAIGVFEIAIASALELSMRAGLLERGLLAVWAAVLTVWGVGLIVAGVGGRLFVRWKRR